MRTRVHTGGRVNPRSSRRGRQVEGSGGVRPSCPTGTIAAMCLWYQMNLVPPSEGPRRVTIVRGRRRGGGDPARVEAAGSCDDGAGPGVSAAGGGVGSGARVLAVGSGGVRGAAAPCWPSDLGGKARGSWPAGIPDPRRSMGDDGHGADVRVERVRRGGDPAWRACDRGVAVGDHDLKTTEGPTIPEGTGEAFAASRSEDQLNGTACPVASSSADRSGPSVPSAVRRGLLRRTAGQKVV